MDFEVIQTTEENTVVVIDDQPAEVISEGILGPAGTKGDKGDKGDQGIPGPNEIGGLAVQLTSPMDGDILAIGANKVINISAPSLTDGGNF
jgi:hypothetical protein